METEGVAMLKVRVMNYGHGISMQRRRDKWVGMERRTSSTNSLTRSRIGSRPSLSRAVLADADGGKCRSSFWRESDSVLAWR